MEVDARHAITEIESLRSLLRRAISASCVEDLELCDDIAEHFKTYGKAVEGD